MADTPPTFTLTARDALAGQTLATYRDLCTAEGLHTTATHIQAAIAEIQQWQYDHPDQVNLPTEVNP